MTAETWPWAGVQAGITSPPARVAAVTPDDDEDLPRWARGLWVNGAGLVKVTTIEGDTATLYFPQGQTGCLIRRVWADGLTATGVHAIL